MGLLLYDAAGQLLVIVKKQGDEWVVDTDSAHIFEYEGGNYPVQEISISRIRAVSEEVTI